MPATELISTYKASAIGRKSQLRNHFSIMDVKCRVWAAKNAKSQVGYETTFSLVRYVAN